MTNRIVGAALVLIVALLMLAAGCATAPEWTRARTAQGAAIGTVAGAAGGAILAPRGSAGTGAIIGAVVGGLAGGGVGYYLDRQAAELERIQGAQVQRQGERLSVRMNEAVLFDFDSATLKPEATPTLAKVAGVLKRYPESKVIVKGYTDNVGAEEKNQKLSERRAQMVGNFLVAQDVAASRLTAVGLGESLPVAGNATPEGRAKNRRVELEIIPEPAQG